MKLRAFIQQYPVAIYFGLAFLISYGAFMAVAGPQLIHREGMLPTDAAFLVPVIVVTVCLLGIVLTRIVDGKSGLRDLFARAGRWRVSVIWYTVALLMCPVLMLAMLLALSALVSPDFAPSLFPLGIVFGLLSGFLEDIGWMGYAFPRMALKRSALSRALLLGVLWGLWHTPVVAASHGVYWLPFFLTFVASVVAMRVLIVWIYSNTGSLLLAQVMHASFSITLVTITPLHVSLAPDTLRYALYAALLWVVVALVVARYGKHLVLHSGQVQVRGPFSD